VDGARVPRPRDPRRRGALADATLDLLDACFAADTVTAHGQPFLFLPRPARPPLFIGGAPPHAFRRALKHRAGWLPVGLPPDVLRAPVAELRTAAAAVGVPPPEVAVMTSLPLDDPAATRERLAAYADAGATRVIHGARYADLAEFEAVVDRLARAAIAP
jgi:alkanesulfonate monooxygenase SsuD/methylene tetrahydromethanopterin reductase-like flavin-dependent oxidoreductase (luciferase family)